MSDYLQPQEPSMPVQVRALQLTLFAIAGATLVFLLFAIVVYADAGDVGASAGMPFILGTAGAGFAVMMRPGRLAVRVGIIVVQALWLLVALGRLNNDDVTGAFALVLPIAVLILGNLAPVRAYFARSNK